MDYHLTQVFTGHGCFRQYLKRIGKLERDECPCGEGTDDAEHTLFKCAMFSRCRLAMELSLGTPIGKDNLVDVMLRGRNEWKIVQEFAKNVMSGKERKERKGGKNRGEERGAAAQNP